jgi:ferritin-like metal-binding protein YciE
MASSQSNTTSGGMLPALFEHALKDIYYAEKKIHKTLPTMIDAARDQGLKSLLADHRKETAAQIEDLEHVFELLGKPPKAEKCEAIDGILEEGSNILEDFGNTPAGDAAIIFSCQAVEHYEITRYGSMEAWARVGGMTEIAGIIDGILQQEKGADQKLSKLAIARINDAAEGDIGSSSDDEDEGPRSDAGTTGGRASTARQRGGAQTKPAPQSGAKK